jgi:hypothetical protein
MSIADDFTTLRRFIKTTLQAPGSGVVEVEPGEVAGAFTDCLDRIEASLRCAEADRDAHASTSNRLRETNQLLGEAPTVPALLELIRRLQEDAKIATSVLEHVRDTLSIVTTDLHKKLAVIQEVYILVESRLSDPLAVLLRDTIRDMTHGTGFPRIVPGARIIVPKGETPP